jgi:fructuronate reductase
MTKRLNHATLPEGVLIGAAAPERTGIVHLGLGNFHRAHAAVYTALAMAAEPGDWGVVGVANRSHSVVDALREQDNLYSILQLTPTGEDVGVVDVHRRTLVAADDAPQVVKEIADQAHKIVTITVSENGYHRSARTGDLDLESPDIKADLVDPANPRTAIGLLARGLDKRAAESGAPVTILSCDNLQSAGTMTHMLVEQFLRAAGGSAEVFDWVARSVTFPNAMVDRIVPGSTDQTRAEVERVLGVADTVPVPAEAFTVWVIEDNFAAGRPKWEAAGAIFTDEVEAYELVKLRLLNGTHSLIAYLGALDGRWTIPESRGQGFVESAARAVIEDEFLPSVTLPKDFDVEGYIASLFERWSNSSLGHKASQVGSDGSGKLLQRVPEPALRLLDKGILPQHLGLTVAAWICCVAPPTGFAPGPVADAMQDAARGRLAEVTAGRNSVRAHVQAVMNGGFFPDDLTARTEFTDRVADYTELIVTRGVRAAAAEALATRATDRS